MRQRTGVDLAEMNPTMLRNAVAEHMHDVGVEEFSAYGRMLHGTVTRVDELSERLAVIESWFFRDVGPFDLLLQFAKQEWREPRSLRVLSIPCAGGEEPYSAAMTLLRAGLRPDQFEIQAVDHSRAALQTAASGTYKEHSFRTEDLTFRDRFFARVGEFYQLEQRVVDCVNFSTGNIMDPQWVARMGTFDIVLCRNLLIYFTPEARKRTWEHLDRLMSPGALLFVGSAELGQFAEVPAFARVDPPRCFALRKREPERERPAATRPRRRPDGNTNTQTSAPGRVPTPAAPEQPSPPVPVSETAVLDGAERLADEGRLGEAADSIIAYLDADASKPRPYYLLALIRTAENDDEAAEELLNKALYLDPGYHAALLHLSSLVRRRGDENRALHLEDRARRGQRRQIER
jgi:chemotaxis protein methyltransferase WspC